MEDEQFVIPRNFYVNYDLKTKSVCKKAGAFLSKHNFIKIDHQNPQVSLREELYSFMLERRQLHKVFDMIKCDEWSNIVERNGFASEKNLILKDCFVTL